MLLVAAGWAMLVAALIARAVRQFCDYPLLEAAGPSDQSDPDAAPSVLVVVPARNEGRNIGRCLSGVLGQDYPGNRLRVAVVDDHSADDTGQIVRRFAASDNRCRLIEGKPLPPGWTGKSFACLQGAESEPADWLCFLDADTLPEPGLIAAAMRHCRREQLDMLSVEPFQQLGSFWERMIIPPGMLLLAFTGDIRRVNDASDPAAAANGQFLLFRRTTYEAVGGHQRVRTEICEDTALARLVKHAGLRLGLVGGERFVSTRMYTGLRPLWEGLSKNLTETIGSPAKTLVAAAGALVLGWGMPLVPIVAIVHAAAAGGGASIVAAVLAVAGSAALVGIQIGTLRHFKSAWWFSLLLPISCSLGAALGVHAVWQRRRGRVAWKGRTYAAPSDLAPAASATTPVPPTHLQ